MPLDTEDALICMLSLSLTFLRFFSEEGIELYWVGYSYISIGQKKAIKPPISNSRNQLFVWVISGWRKEEIVYTWVRFLFGTISEFQGLKGKKENPSWGLVSIRVKQLRFLSFTRAAGSEKRKTDGADKDWKKFSRVP